MQIISLLSLWNVLVISLEHVFCSGKEDTVQLFIQRCYSLFTYLSPTRDISSLNLLSGSVTLSTSLSPAPFCYRRLFCSIYFPPQKITKRNYFFLKQIHIFLK